MTTLNYDYISSPLSSPPLYTVLDVHVCLKEKGVEVLSPVRGMVWSIFGGGVGEDGEEEEDEGSTPFILSLMVSAMKSDQRKGQLPMEGEGERVRGGGRRECLTTSPQEKTNKQTNTFRHETLLVVRGRGWSRPSGRSRGGQTATQHTTKGTLNSRTDGCTRQAGVNTEVQTLCRKQKKLFDQQSLGEIIFLYTTYLDPKEPCCWKFRRGYHQQTQQYAASVT